MTAIRHRHPNMTRGNVHMRATGIVRQMMNCNNFRLTQHLSICRSLASSAGQSGLQTTLMLTLERSVGDSLGADTQLRNTNAFQAEVFPDLPIATTWGNLWKVLKRSGLSATQPSTGSPLGEADVAPNITKVMTVAANFRSLEKIRDRMIKATSPPDAPADATGSVPATASRAADALLLVSGSHPVRSLPGSRQLLPTSVTMLKMAGQLKSSGALPARTQLWAVANPNVEENAAWLEQKVEQGAQVILTQPPLDVDSFSRWVDDARSRGLLDKARLVVGHPMISSSGNLAFWMSLSGCLTKPACRALLQSFTAQEARDKASMEQFCAEYNDNLAKQVLGWPGIGGFHLMPITPRGKKACIKAVQEGGVLHGLGPSQH